MCEPFLAASGPLANVMRVYEWQIWRPPNPVIPKRSVLDLRNEVKDQPDDAVMAKLQVANEQVSLRAAPCVDPACPACRALTLPHCRGY